MTETATFAAGCFWGVEHAFRQVKGVVDTAVGYTGGTTAHPTYEQVCRHGTGHAEAVQVTYDPRVVSYEQLLERFWSIHNPTTKDRQGPDVGSQYRSAIFFHTPKQQAEAEASKQALAQRWLSEPSEVADRQRVRHSAATPIVAAAPDAVGIRPQSRKFSRPIVTEIVPASTFWRAEEYHQRYFEKNKNAQCHIPGL